MKEKCKLVNGTTLKILAMVLMLCDHIWATNVLRMDWLTALGRIAFPIFAFQIAEGCARTHNFKAYALRMLIFALVSEIPFNLMVGGSIFYPLHQNVMFTFLFSMLLIRWLDYLWSRQWRTWQKLVTLLGVGLTGWVLGFVTFTDYYGFGILTVLLFYVTREQKWGWVVQLIGMWYINWIMMGGLSYVFHVGGRELWIPQQGFAMLALIPIWLYNGKRGPGGKKFQYFCYAFYPVHMLLLALINMFILQK